MTPGPTRTLFLVEDSEIHACPPQVIAKRQPHLAAPDDYDVMRLHRPPDAVLLGAWWSLRRTSKQCVSHHIEDGVLLDGSPEKISTGAGCPNHHIFTSVRFRTKGNEGLLPIVSRGRVLARRIGTFTSGNGAGTVCIAKCRVGFPIPSKLRLTECDRSQDSVSSHRIATHRQRVTVVRSGYNQGFIKIDKLERPGNGIIESCGVGQSTIGISAMMRMVDPPALNEQNVPLTITGKSADRHFHHVCQRSFPPTSLARSASNCM